MLWDDTFVRYYEPKIGMAAVKVLEAAGFQVELARGRKCCGRPAFSQGNLDDARRLGHKLCDVSALIYVSCREGSAAHGTTELLRRAGAQEAALLDGLPTGLAA